MNALTRQRTLPSSAKSALQRRCRFRKNYIRRVIQFAKQGYKDIEFDTYNTDWDSAAYLTVAGQKLEQLRSHHR